MTNQLIKVPAIGGATMSSVEIANFTGKRHRDVLRDIRKMLENVQIDVRSFAHIFLDEYGREQPCYNLPERECLFVIAKYSDQVRLAIIDKLAEQTRINQELQVSIDFLRDQLHLPPPVSRKLVNSSTTLTYFRFKGLKQYPNFVKLEQSLDPLLERQTYSGIYLEEPGVPIQVLVTELVRTDKSAYWKLEDREGMWYDYFLSESDRCWEGYYLETTPKMQSAVYGHHNFIKKLLGDTQ